MLLVGKDLLQITQPKSLQEPKEKEKDKDMDKDIDNNNSKENKTTEASSRTAALPLTMKKAGVRGGPLRRHEEHGEQRGHDTKISKIFQLAVTTLSFLAFGGYLLTLIITSARRASMNNMTMTPANVIVFSVSIFANHLAKLFLLYKQHIPLRTIKDKITVSIVSHKLAKNQNLQKVGKYQRPKRSSPFYLDPSENDFDTDRLYNGMIMLSKGYVLYHNGKLGF